MAICTNSVAARARSEGRPPAEVAYDLMMQAPYEGSFLGLRSVNEPPLAEAVLFDCNTPALRDPKVTKGLAPFEGAQAAACCSSVSGCC